MGETLGPYELQDELGRGGMGVVYRAVHRPTGVVRAVKVLGQAPDAEATERFRREAAALARAAGEGVVPVHELGVANGRMFLAMPLLEGGSLQQRLARTGPLAWRDACALVLEVARALERCHAAGLVHRDLKPANLLYDGSGRVLLADFGCVRDLAAPRLTQTGTLLGTPSYMAPELFAGAKADARVDVYSLGAVLYELVVGHAPYRGASPVQVLGQATAGKRAALPASAPRELDALLAAALEPAPGDRIASASELAARLERVLAGAGADADRGRSTRVVGVVVAAVACGAAALLVARPSALLAPVAAPQATTPRPPSSPTSTAPVGSTAPVDELARARDVLGSALEGRDLLLALEEAVPASPATVDSALALQIVGRFWPADDLVLASEAFAVAARVHDQVPQPARLVVQLESELVIPGVGPEVLAAALRLGRRPAWTLVMGHEDALRAAVESGRAGWAEELALAHVLNEVSNTSKAAREGDIAAMRSLGERLAMSVDRRAGLPRGARAAARMLILQHRVGGRRRDRPLAPELPYLMAFAEDLDWADGAYVMAADAALDEGDLAAARPFIENARRTCAERLVEPYADLSPTSPPGRPWVAPTSPPTTRSAGVRRHEALLKIIDDGADPLVVLAGIDPRGRQQVHGHLEQLGRVADAARVAAAMTQLGETPSPAR